MLSCPKCGANYSVQRSLEFGQNVRNICKCEASRVCGHTKRTKKATCGDVRQVLLDADSAIEMYVCERHADAGCIDDLAPPKAKESKKKAAPEPYKAIETVEEYKASVANLDIPMICLLCKHRHPFNSRVVTLVEIDGKRSFERSCPKCSAPVYAEPGPPWDMSYMSVQDYDNPPEQKEAPKPAALPKRKKK